MKITAIIPAAGKGNRYSKTKNKLLDDLSGKPVLIRTLEVISSVEEITEIIVCTSCKEVAEAAKGFKIAPGGQTRQESVYNGLKAAEVPDLVVIHDGARPLVTPEIISQCIQTAAQKGAAIAAVPTKDTIKRINPDTGKVAETLNRNELWNIQTPQAFLYKNILQTHHDFAGQDFTDDAALMEKSGFGVFVVQSCYKNIKITTQEDLATAKSLMGI